MAEPVAAALMNLFGTGSKLECLWFLESAPLDSPISKSLEETRGYDSAFPRSPDLASVPANLT